MRLPLKPDGAPHRRARTGSGPDSLRAGIAAHCAGAPAGAARAGAGSAGGASAARRTAEVVVVVVVGGGVALALASGPPRHAGSDPGEPLSGQGRAGAPSHAGHNGRRPAAPPRSFGSGGAPSKPRAGAGLKPAPSGPQLPAAPMILPMPRPCLAITARAARCRRRRAGATRRRRDGGGTAAGPGSALPAQRGRRAPRPP